MKKTLFAFTIHLLFLTVSFSQINYEAVNNSVYNFLERMSVKGITQLNEEIKPYSRIYIAGKIKEINSKIKIQNSKEKIQNSKLGTQNLEFNISGLEREELKFYIREYSSELGRLGFDLTKYTAVKKLIDLNSDRFGFDRFNRFRLFSYNEDEFGLYVDPVLSYEYNNYKNGSWWSYSNGISLYGYLGKHVGFDLQFYDNHPRGENIDKRRNFSPETGYEFIVGKGDGYDYDRMNANLNFSWKYITLSIGKDFNYYGSGENGKLIMSNKAPSFPYLKLEVNPVDWLKFSYIHGVLNSRIIDSTTIRLNPLRDHFSLVEKYLVTHILSLTPFSFLNFSIGESVIYSDKIQPIYMIPVSFFRMAEHYLGAPDENTGNAQIFSSFWYKNYLLQTKFFGSIFIDELSTYDGSLPQAVGYNVGFKSVDPVIPESEVVFEYTRINPFVYHHADPAQTYQNYGYDMGHWIGSNADQIFVSFRKRILRGLNIDLAYSYIRKGDDENFVEPRYLKKNTFLWGDQKKYSLYKVIVNYELLHNFNIRFFYESNNIFIVSPETNIKSNIVGFSSSYGL